MPCLDPIMRIASRLCDHMSAGIQSGCLTGPSCNRCLGLDASGDKNHPRSRRAVIAGNRRAKRWRRVFFKRQSSGQPVVLAASSKVPTFGITHQSGQITSAERFASGVSYFLKIVPISLPEMAHETLPPQSQKSPLTPKSASYRKRRPESYCENSHHYAPSRAIPAMPHPSLPSCENALRGENYVLTDILALSENVR